MSALRRSAERSVENESRGIQRSAEYKHQQQLGRWYVGCSPGHSAEKAIRRHKCLNERGKAVCEQTGAVQCQTCRRWFKNRGGLGIHNCKPGS